MADSVTASKPGLARWLVVIIPYLWMVLFFLTPFLIIVKISLSDTAIAMPPYTPVLEGFAAIGDFIKGVVTDVLEQLSANVPVVTAGGRRFRNDNGVLTEGD